MKTWLANTRRSWLLIIDNADDPDVDNAVFFPSGQSGNIVMTTRNLQCRDHATIGFEDLNHLDLRDATSLLLKVARKAELSNEDNQEAAEKVVQALESHTLAIIQAGASIKLGYCSLEEYPIFFKEQEERILKFCPIQDRSRYGSVYKTFEVSATLLESSEDPSAMDALSLLQILGFIHFQEIPELMFLRAREKSIAIRKKIAAGRSSDELYNLSELQISRLPLLMTQGNEHSFRWRWRRTLSLLESYSIIKFNGAGENGSFSMHPLIHKWTCIRQEIGFREESWRAAGSIIALSIRGVYDMFHEKLRSHVGVYLDQPLSENMAEMTEVEICQTQYSICYLLHDLRDYSKLRFLLQILEGFQAWTGSVGEISLRVQELTAKCLIEERQYQKAIELLEQLDETDSFDNRNAQSLLAEAYIRSKQTQKAVSLLEHIIEIEERTEARDEDTVLTLQRELGMAYIDCKQVEKATAILEQVVETMKKTMIPSHRSLLDSQIELARAYIGTKQYERAARVLEQVYEIRRTILDITHADILLTQGWLAKAYASMGNDHYEKAAELYEKVVRMREKMLGPDDSQLLASQHNLANVYINMKNGHDKRAAELLEHVVGIEEKTLAHDDRSRLRSQKLLAKAYIGMGKDHYERAAELLEHVSKMNEKSLASDDPSRRKTKQLLEDVHSRIEAEKDAKSLPIS